MTGDMHMRSKRDELLDNGTKRQLKAIVLLTALTLVLGIADANAARGGGGGSRGGGGGRMAQSSVSAANRAMPSRSAGQGSANRVSANTGNANRGNVNTGNVNRGNINTGNVNTGNVNRGNINTGNVNIGNDVNIDIDGSNGWHGGVYHHPIAAGVVIGSVAVTTAAVVGSYYRTLPASCTVVVRNGISYHYCGSVYYQQTWSGNDVVYVVATP